MSILQRLVRDRTAASATEFAVVLPVLLAFLFGIIDAGRFMWTYNRLEKATQMGVRYAVVTDPVLNGLSTYSFATTGEVSAGDPVGTAYFTSATCSNTSCTCVSTSGGFCGSTSLNSPAFTNLVNRMKLMSSRIAASNVQVDYKNVGLGFSGDPNGADMEPLVTVRLTGLTFHPITCFVFPCSIAMPSFSAALTAEDLSGNVSN